MVEHGAQRVRQEYCEFKASTRTCLKNKNQNNNKKKRFTYQVVMPKVTLEISGFLHLRNTNMSWALVFHAFNPSYPGGRDQEDPGLKPDLANSLRDPILKIPITKRSGGVAQGEGPEFKPQY
jgi:hypothetical protein